MNFAVFNWIFLFLDDIILSNLAIFGYLSILIAIRNILSKYIRSDSILLSLHSLHVHSRFCLPIFWALPVCLASLCEARLKRVSVFLR